MTIEIRPLTESHIWAFYELCEEMREEKAGVSFARIEDTGQIKQWLNDEKIYLYGAFSEDRLLGVFKAERGGFGKEHSCYIAGAITRRYRAKGLASKLLNGCLYLLNEQGVWMIRAKVYSNNIASIASLLSAGFTLAGTIHKHQWDEKAQKYIDDLIFHKELPH